MGLFDAFKKKQCDVCGEDIGLLGNRKLEDGNLCKNCAKKLSPWFDDRRHSTVEQIKQQLAYREANKEKVAMFRATRTIGERTKLYLDEDAGVFFVTKTGDIKDENPDVIAFSDVTGCRVEVDESYNELTREDKDGNEVSYNPPRYRYDYDFDVVIDVRNPYFDDMRFRLNPSSVDIEYVAGGATTARIGNFSIGLGSNSTYDPMNYPEYRRYMEMGEEIKSILLGVRQQAREAAAAAAAPKAAVTCPYCGATTTPNASGQCEFCGGAVNG